MKRKLSQLTAPALAGVVKEKSAQAANIDKTALRFFQRYLKP